MSFRPSYDSQRYNPRRRSRSPPPSYDRRPSASAESSSYNNAHRGQTSSLRGPGPASYYSDDVADTHRGTGRPQSATRDRFHSRDQDGFDRRRPPSPPLSRPPYRDIPPSPPAPDVAPSPRTDARDSSYNTASSFSQRGGFTSRGGRYRGRGGYDDARRRPPPSFNERESFRRPSSPPPRYGSRDQSVGDSGERRPDGRPYQDREFRDREAAWSSRRDFDNNPSRPDTRSAGDDSRPPTPHQQPPSSAAGAYKRSREDEPIRRSSGPGVYTGQGTGKDARYDAPASAEVSKQARLDNISPRFAKRDSPPPQAPSVPEFGSFAFAPPAVTGPSSAEPDSTATRPPKADHESADKDEGAKALSSVAQSDQGPPGRDVERPQPAAELFTSSAPQSFPRAAAEQQQQQQQEAIGPASASSQSQPVSVPHTKTSITPTGSYNAKQVAGGSAGPPQQMTTSGPPPDAPRQPRSHDDREVSGTPSLSHSQLDIIAPRGPAAHREDGPPLARRLTNPPHRSPPANFVRLGRGMNDIRSQRSQSFNAQKVASADFFPRQNSPEFDGMPFSVRGSADNDQHPYRAAKSDRATPPPSAPTGPRAHTLNTSPRPQQPPTAPRAERMSASGFRGPSHGRPTDVNQNGPARAPGPRALVWTNPKILAANRDSVIPLKRSSSGESKDLSSRPVAQGAFSENADRLKRIEGALSAEHTAEKPQNTSTIPPSPKATDDKLIQDRMDLDEIGDPIEPLLSDVSSDDGMDLDEDDVEVTTAKFERQRSQLTASLVDLSGRDVRATTPLQTLAILCAINDSHLQKYRRPSQEPQARMTRKHTAPKADPALEALTDTARIEFLTPKEEEDVDETAKRQAILDRLPRRRRIESHDVRLPFLARSPVSPRESAEEQAMKQTASQDAVFEHMLEVQRTELDADERLMDEYQEIYRNFALVARQMDEDRAAREETEAQTTGDYDITSAESGPLSAETPTLESSRRLKFSSEYDIQKVLKESEETARIEQEKLERASKKARDDLEKEARVPILYSRELAQRRIFVSRNTLHDPHFLTDVYGFDPPIDNFSADEQRTFAVAFKERPKKWGEIATLLPGRTYQDCIHHYYTNKWDGRFRETKGKRRSKMGRGRGGRVGRVRGAALMADLGRVDEEAPAGESSGSTASGRPKRAASSRVAASANAAAAAAAAAATASEKDKEDGAKAASNTTPNKKTAVKLDIDTGADKEKAVKQRRKKEPGEKIPRKAKGQGPSGGAVASDLPQTVEPSQDVIMEDVGLPFTSRAAEGAQGTAAVKPAPETTAAVTPDPPRSLNLATEASGERTRGQGTHGGSRSSASSYWSVPEQQDFVKFISYFGTDFAAIAAHMGTKTQTMVKNYYQRSVDGGSRPDLEAFAKAGNERRERGEDIGPPPPPTQTVKRRVDNPGVTAAGTSLQVPPTGDGALAHSTANFVPTTPKAEPIAAPLVQQQPVGVSHVFDPNRSLRGPVDAMPSHVARNFVDASPVVKADPGRSAPEFDHIRRGPLMSTQPPVQGDRWPVQQSPITSDVKPSAGPDGKLSWYQELSRENVMHRDADSRGSVQPSPMQEQAAPVRPLPSGPPYGSPPNDRPMSAHGPGPQRPPLREEMLMTPAFLPTARPGQGVLRNILGANMSPIGPPKTENPFANRDPSPPKYIGFRPSSVPAALANQPPPLPPTQKAEPPKDPPRRSNLASLLNSEPEEPKSRKRPADQLSQPATRPQSPAPMQPRGPTPVGQPFMPPQRPDPYDPAPSSRPIYDRPAMSAASPATPYDVPGGHWNNPPSARPRDDWTPRHSVAPPYSSATANSPNPMYERERQPPFYQPRQSMPPNPAMFPPGRTRSPAPPAGHPQPPVGHSRTSSYGQSTPVDKTAMPRPPYGASYDSREPPSIYPPNKPFPSYTAMQSPQTQQMPGPPTYPPQGSARVAHSRHGSREEADRERYEQERSAYERDRERGYRGGPAGSPYPYPGPPPSQMPQDMPPGQYTPGGPHQQSTHRQSSVSDRGGGGLREMAAREYETYMSAQFGRGQQQAPPAQRMEYEQRYGAPGSEYGNGSRPTTASRKDYPPPPGSWVPRDAGPGPPGHAPPGPPYGAPVYPPQGPDERERRQMLENSLRADGAIVRSTSSASQPPSGLSRDPHAGYPSSSARRR